MAQVVASRVTRRTVGAVADGAFKVLLGAAGIVGAAPLGRLLGTPAWLMAVSGVALLIGGGIEIGYTRSRSMRTYTRLMIAYDSGWVLTALAGLLMARQGSGAGGEVWMGYQTAAPVLFAALLIAAAPVQMASDTQNSA
ncbi:hypothetical protein OHU11_20545 [Streptomyces sp. NBC_00257]|uniref:hypothetical protein n=1 Tax=unclassified Streptomyces TaxID=2593676 RepID=UPI002254469A|nr:MULTISPECIES: hypothetical protein [unclassified Streptomyces]WTB55783.1 hypothetical protein OG832_22825 [Streptomyces sp. NBC_00826]WTH91334.1 hypothetical protein OIC43_20870 [Streptomyces sp. NBC_00825]WTI00062.1 hypothetical protein OHA23_20855 [Streptomyces sp. NBC_00822]MCX4865545.1 hypothetical protein [Streptomyces sp. NBC_00906]MCX4896783.1 hypothetical protein [Streptomyces sp. NBC_00892]